MSIEKSSSKAYEKYLNVDLKEGDTAIELKDADNGNIYLKPGKYVIELSKDGKTEKTDLEIEKR